MTSSINYSNIDSAYPVAGQDNDSQGFRDNFTNIKTALQTTKTELEDLQGKVLLKSALSGDSLDNDMSGALVTSMKVTDLRETKHTVVISSGTADIDIENGPYQIFDTSAGGNTDITFSNFPAAGNFSRVRLSIDIRNTNDTITLPNDGSSIFVVGAEGIQGADLTSDPYVITFRETGVFDFEFSTDDGGTTITIVDLTRSKENVRANNEGLDDGAAANLNVTTSYFTTAAAETATLADGVEGQTKVFIMTGDVGDMVITVASAGWKAGDAAGTITFDDKGDGCTLQFINSAWYCVGNNGCTFA
jgi:hypothetical protein